MALAMIEWDPALDVRALPRISEDRPRPGIDYAAAGVFADHTYLVMPPLPPIACSLAHVEEQSANLAAA